MNCRTCNAPLLAGHLHQDCVACLAKKSHQGILDMQGEYLLAVMKGSPPLVIYQRKGNKENRWHIEMLGVRGQAFCGMLFERQKGRSLWNHRERVFDLLFSEEQLCSECKKILDAKATAAAMGARP